MKLSDYPISEIPKLDPQIKADWLALLRSGTYQQTTTRLAHAAQSNCFCALGLGMLACGATPEDLRGNLIIWNPYVPGQPDRVNELLITLGKPLP